MKLWEYLSARMEKHADKVAFAHSGLKYADILKVGDGRARNKKLRVCEGRTREEHALAILRCIAEGDTAVPVSAEYGVRNCEYVKAAAAKSRDNADSLAFVLFTSGTAGAPKGVMLTDKNICENLKLISSYFRLEECERICIARPLAHAAVITGELLYGLCCGLTVSFYEEAFMPRRLALRLREERADVFCATPTLYSALAKESKTQNIPLKVGAVSGEPLAQKSDLLMLEAFPETAFYNAYGLTEHSPRVSALEPSKFGILHGSVGKPIGGVQTKIQNRELLIKSPCVMKGYLGDDAGTKKKMTGGWLFTGDAAHFDSEGYLYIDGRKDDMMIRAGLNVYPQEIENAALCCNGVQECAAYCEQSERGTLLCLKYTGTAEPKAVRRELCAVLNPNIVPNKIERAAELVVGAGGKKLRK